MSRFDPLGAWMQGSQLGQQQYAQLAGLAQNEAAMRQRQAEEAARREAQAQQLSMEQARFGEAQRMNTAALDRWSQQAALDAEDRAREEAIRQQEQEYLGFARDWAKQRVRGAVGGMGGGGGMVDAGGMQIPATIAAPNMQMPPETEAMLRMIDAANGDQLKQLLPHLDRVDEHRRVQLLVEGIDKGGFGRMLQDPFHRAAFETYKAAGDPENMMRIMAQDYSNRQQQSVLADRRAYTEQQAAAKAAAEDKTWTDAAAAFGRLRRNESKDRDADFALARRAGLVNQEDVSISGREAPDSYKKTPEYQLAEMDVELAERAVRASESPENQKRLADAMARLRSLVAARVPGGAPPAPGARARDAIDDAIDAALGDGAMPKN